MICLQAPVLAVWNRDDWQTKQTDDQSGVAAPSSLNKATASCIDKRTKLTLLEQGHELADRLRIQTQHTHSGSLTA